MKRKSIKIIPTSMDVLYKETDFYRRFGKSLQRGLKDHKYTTEFTLDPNRRYTDDPNQERFEIAQANDEEYLVFHLSVVKVSFAMDEAKFFDRATVNLELRADRLDSFSKVGSFSVSILANVVMCGIFLGAMYLLFPSLRSVAFAVF